MLANSYKAWVLFPSKREAENAAPIIDAAIDWNATTLFTTKISAASGGDHFSILAIKLTLTSSFKSTEEIVSRLKAVLADANLNWLGCIVNSFVGESYTYVNNEFKIKYKNAIERRKDAKIRYLERSVEQTEMTVRPALKLDLIASIIRDSLELSDVFFKVDKEQRQLILAMIEESASADSA